MLIHLQAPDVLYCIFSAAHAEQVLQSAGRPPLYHKRGHQSPFQSRETMSADGAAEAEQTAGTKPAKKKRSNLFRCAAAPLRALRRARDMYVRSLGGCAGAGGGGGRGAPMTGATAGMFAMMPRARSVNAFGNSSNGFGGGGEEDFRELVRANSKQEEARGAGLKQAIRRSQSVAPAIGRIDEEAPGSEDFEGDEYSNGSLKSGVSRSKSCAVAPAGRRINGVGVKAA